MLYTLRFFPSKCSLFHNANLFGSCIIHILYKGCAEIKKKFRRRRVKWSASRASRFTPDERPPVSAELKAG